MQCTVRLAGLAALVLFSFSAMSAEIVIESNDAMQYNVKAFEVKAGETVKLTLKHVGKLPKTAMGHNLVLLKVGTDAMKYGMSVPGNGGTPANGYIPTDTSAIIAHTEMIGGGETTTIEFTAPSEPGAYPYVCTFPGHAALMRGVMTVK